MDKQYVVYVPSIKRKTIIHHLPEFADANKLRRIHNQIIVLGDIEKAANENLYCKTAKYSTQASKDLLCEYGEKIIAELSMKDSLALDEKVGKIVDYIGQVLTMCDAFHVRRDSNHRYILAGEITKEKLTAVNSVLNDMYKMTLIKVTEDVPRPPIVIDDPFGLSNARSPFNFGPTPTIPGKSPSFMFPATDLTSSIFPVTVAESGTLPLAFSFSAPAKTENDSKS